MVNNMAVRMEIQSLLTDGRCRKNERPEGRIESLPDASGSNEGFAVVVAHILLVRKHGIVPPFHLSDRGGLAVRAPEPDPRPEPGLVAESAPVPGEGVS